jgi:hypothetical protein
MSYESLADGAKKQTRRARGLRAAGLPASCPLLADRSDRALIDRVLDAIVIVIGALDDMSLAVRLQLEDVRTYLGAETAAHAHVLIDDGLRHRLLLPDFLPTDLVAEG